MLALERAKLSPAPFFPAITGGTSTGRRWRLTYTAGTAAVVAAMKAGGVAAGGFGGGGAYVPVTAVQRWSAAGGGGGGGPTPAPASSTSPAPARQAGAIENGVFLGWLGALVFGGTFDLAGRRLPFALDSLRVRVGPKWFEFPFSTTRKGGGGDKGGGGPFFLRAYVDDGVVVARGKSGGMAVWARAGDAWCARAGVDA